MNEVINAIGRRKSSVARVYVSEGNGKIVINKITNTLAVKAAAKTASLTTLKSKAVVVAPITVTNAKGTVTYSKVSGDSKLSVNKTTGKITVAKGTAKGTHTATITTANDSSAATTRFQP